MLHKGAGNEAIISNIDRLNEVNRYLLKNPDSQINSDVHLSKIRMEWDDFYDDFPPGTSPTKQQLLDKATEIDNMFGELFSPPIRSFY